MEAVSRLARRDETQAGTAGASWRDLVSVLLQEVAKESQFDGVCHRIIMVLSE